MGVDPDKDVIYFGKTDFRGADRLFGIRRTDRRQHMYIIGKTGTGKSVLLNNLIIQDIANGEGVAVVDPHGELVESILAKIPENRLKDVIYFNPADTDYHLGFNVLELPDPKYKHLVASGLMSIFTKIWANVWSARMEYIMNNAILALLETPNSTLLGITRILVDKEFRQKIINNVTDPVVKAFWIHEYEEWQDKFRNEAIAPIQNKVGQFLSTALIRNVVGQAKSSIDIFDIMNSGKIFLVNVSKGRIGEDNSSLLGAMLITKMQLSAMERVRIPEDERVDFYLYVDEFQNFATDSFAGVLSEARKYRLNLTVAHQYVGQLVTDVSTKVRDAIFGNVGTMIVFRVGAADAEFLEPEFTPEFLIPDIVNLPNYHIYLKLMTAGVTSRPFSAKTLPPLKLKDPPLTVEEVVEHSRKRYARKREAVEEEIRAWAGMAGPGETTGSPSPNLPPADGPGGTFKVICSSCGRETKVPFAPEPGRPVYCKDCLAGIKDGTIKPVRRREFVQTKARTTDTSALSAIGIEFAPEQAKPRPAGAPPGAAPRRGPATPATAHSTQPRQPASSRSFDQAPFDQTQGKQGKPRRSIFESFEEAPADTRSAPPSLSLSSLQPKEEKNKHESSREAVDVEAMRRAISESLSAKEDGAAKKNDEE